LFISNYLTFLSLLYNYSHKKERIYTSLLSCFSFLNE